MLRRLGLYHHILDIPFIPKNVLGTWNVLNTVLGFGGHAGELERKSCLSRGSV